jgi:acetoin utilization deacetylase AcuC-like enzyme
LPHDLCAVFHTLAFHAFQFDPELVVVSSGFDAAWGDPLGKCKLSPEIYGHMTHHLVRVAGPQEDAGGVSKDSEPLF